MTARPSDVEWTRRLIDCISEGGVWGVPMNGNIYRFSRQRQTVTLSAGVTDDTHETFVECLQEIGWKWEDGRPNIA